VLTLNWNLREITIECIDSILKSDYDNFRVLVVDNGSTDQSVHALRGKYGKTIEIIENRRNLGYARGFNVGLHYGFDVAKADYCLVMNNDTILDAYAIDALVKVAETDRMIGFVTGKVYFYDAPDTLQTVGKKEDPIRWNGDHIGLYEKDNGQYDAICERFFADDIFTLVSKHLYREIGGYNPLFFLQGEEYDWQARAKTRGYKVVFTPYAKLWHRVSMTLGRDSAKKAYFDARNPMLVILFHRPVWFFRRYLRYHALHLIVVALRYMKRFQFGAAWRTLQGMMSGLLWAARNRKLTLRHFI
jgi:GT2 family glycosyltransferase